MWEKGVGAAGAPRERLRERAKELERALAASVSACRRHGHVARDQRDLLDARLEGQRRLQLGSDLIILGPAHQARHARPLEAQKARREACAAQERVDRASRAAKERPLHLRGRGRSRTTWVGRQEHMIEGTSMWARTWFRNKNDSVGAAA